MTEKDFISEIGKASSAGFLWGFVIGSGISLLGTITTLLWLPLLISP